MSDELIGVDETDDEMRGLCARIRRDAAAVLTAGELRSLARCIERRSGWPAPYDGAERRRQPPPERRHSVVGLYLGLDRRGRGAARR